MLNRALKIVVIILFITSFHKGSLVLLSSALALLGISSSKHKLPWGLLSLLALPILTGFISGLGNDLYNMFKDVFYFSLPILFFLLGHLVASHFSLNKMIQVVVVSGVLMAILRIAIVVSWAGIGGLTNPYLARAAYGTLIGTPITAVALGILVFLKIYKVKFYTERTFNQYFAICLIGLPMFASRTYFIVALLSVLIACFYKYRGRMVIVGSLTLVTFALILSSVSLNVNTTNPFLMKVLNSLEEVNTGDYGTEEDINTRYRGYETYMAMKTYSKSDIMQQVFGNFGQLIDLETYVGLSENGLRFIPILHNGYCYMIIKSGILGCIFYGFFFLRILAWAIRRLSSSNPQEALLGGIVLSTTISLVITNYIVYGLYNGEMLMLMFMISFFYTKINAVIAEEKAQLPMQEPRKIEGYV